MFDYFKKVKSKEVETLQALADSGEMPDPWPGPRPGFSESLRRKADQAGLAVIAEYKRASPSQGDIALDISPAQAASDYARAGAAAMSVLTEESKFKGDLDFISLAWRGGAEAAGLPILRKDFIISPLQVRATAATEAAAVLLIVKMTPSAFVLKCLREEAESYGLEAVVEVLDEDDLELARESGAKTIQVNARDFSDLSVDLERSLSLARKHAVATNELWIAASGFSRPEELASARQAGFGAVLVGTSLMRGRSLASSLQHLTSKLVDFSQKHEIVLE